MRSENNEKQLQASLFQRCMEQVGFFKGRKIPVYTAGELEYEKSVANSNLLYRFDRPACVVQPEHESHVRIVVKRAKDMELTMRVKNGGHSFAGFSSIQDGISIDLVNMKRVDLDMDAMTITMDAGALWAHAYHELINEHHNGFVINGGRCPSVGVSGFTLGGGLGPFTRSFGLGSDSLIEARIVTPKEKNGVVHVTRDDTDPEKKKLFWALCGAGGNNFGVVTQLKMKVEELHHKDVVAGVYTWSPFQDPKSQEHFTTTMTEFYLAQWSNEMTIDSSWLMDLKDSREVPGVRFLAYYNGLETDFDREVDQRLKSCIKGPEETKSLPQQLKDRTLQEASTRFLHETLVAQWSEETQRSLPSNAMFKISTSFSFTGFSEANKESLSKIIDVLKKRLVAFKKQFKGEEGSIKVSWIHSGGKSNEKEPDYSAYPWRGCVYHTYVMIEWKDKWLEKDMREFLGTLNKELRGYSMNELGVYVNFPDETLDENTYERAYYGENRKELQRIKAVWDKGNIFGWSHGVRPGPHVDGASEAVTSSPPPPSNSAICKGFANPREMLDKFAAKGWATHTPGLGSTLVGPDVL
ncbi:6-hydroxy-d-nicotine oxidase [Fusarium longipes]|uniref:6-hydroxy-d-nicotine oxidase n=1 Tax=Fusarium longipes TaxID=694270 RepID=A0A395SHX0_9HYPO|nr:6-hydroxy-d-nicotine oxidase [Fusarium longipes]